MYTNCLVFADDLAIFANLIDAAIKKIKKLTEIAERIRLQTSIEKTKYIMDINDSSLLQRSWPWLEKEKSASWKKSKYRMSGKY